MLKRIRSMVSLRNNSIFAHGLGPVGNHDFYKFRDFVKEIFEVFCKIEGIDFIKSEKQQKIQNGKITIVFEVEDKISRNYNCI